MLVVAIEYSYEYGIDSDILCNPIKSVCILFSNQKLVLRMSLHQAHILLNNGVAELAIPNTHSPQPALCAVYVHVLIHHRNCTPKQVI